MKRFAILPVFVVFALFTFSCGGGGDGGSSSGSNPRVSFTNLSDNVLLATIVPVEISTAADIRRVKLLIDNVAVATDNSAPFDLLFYSTTLSTGLHRVSVEAYDNTSNPPTVASVNVWVDAVEIRRRAMNILRNHCWGSRDSSGLTVWRFRFDPPVFNILLIPEQLISWGSYSGTAGIEKVKTATKIWQKYTGFPFAVQESGTVMGVMDYNNYSDALIITSWVGLYFPSGTLPSQLALSHKIGHMFFSSNIEASETAQPSIMSASPSSGMDFAIAEAVRILYTELQPGSVI